MFMLLQFLVSPWVAMEKNHAGLHLRNQVQRGDTLYPGMLSVLSRYIEVTFQVISCSLMKDSPLSKEHLSPTIGPITGLKMKFPVCPLYMKSNISLTVLHLYIL